MGQAARASPDAGPRGLPAPSLADTGQVEIIGGYRLVRRIGSGRRAEVFLGYADGDAGVRSAAVKVYLAATPLASIDAEIATIGRAFSPHLLRLDDIATAPGGLPALVLGRLRPVTLARLLAARGRIEPGEAVTVIAPLAGAVAELHRVGVAHGRIGQGSVLFDDSGAPVLASFGRAVVVGPAPGAPPASSMPPAELALRPEVIRDVVDLAELARSVLTLTRAAPGRDAVLAWLAGNDPATEPQGFATQLAEAMFDAAPATRILPPGSPASRRDSRGGAVAAGLRPVGPTGVAVPEFAGAPVRVRGRRSRDARPIWRAALHLPDWVEDLWPKAPRPGRAVARLSRWVAPVRRPVWVGAGTVAALLLAALVLVPADGGAAGPEAAADGSAVSGPSAASVDAPEPPRRAGQADGDPDSVAGRDGTEGASAIAGDDPVTAVIALLDLRRRCLDEGSVLCLDGVHQTGSVAWEADSHRVRRGQEGAGQEGVGQVEAGQEGVGQDEAAQEGTTDSPLLPIPADGQGAALVERMGDSALVTLPATAGGATTVSILMIRSDAGWRIRDLFAG